MKRLMFALVLAFCSSELALAQEMPADYREVVQTLGRSGDYKDGVLKVNVPRNDLHVTIAGKSVPTPFGFGGWAGFTKGDADMDVMMGDLVLTEEEVDPVVSALLDHGLEVTALHNHFFWEQPRIFYLHIHGHGKAAELAQRLKPALDLIPKVAPPAAGAPAANSLDTAKLAAVAGHKGEQLGSVYKITVGRDDLHVTEMGAVINARMGLNTWAAFYGTMEEAMVAGDVAMLETEVTLVVAALRTHGLSVVAIHHHMTGPRPVVIFLHYWGRGPAAQLAAAFRAALDLTAPKKPAHPAAKRRARPKP